MHSPPRTNLGCQLIASLERRQTLYQNCARQAVGALAQLVGADQVARGIVQSKAKRLVLQYDPTDMIFDGRDKQPVKAEVRLRMCAFVAFLVAYTCPRSLFLSFFLQINGEGDLIVTITMTPRGTIQIENPLRVRFDKIFNIAVAQGQAKTLVRMKEMTEKGRVNAYLDVEFRTSHNIPYILYISHSFLI
jgi:hypothetical protein